MIATTIIIAAMVAQPVVKNGQCPGGYVQSGNYCAPMSDKSERSIPKIGQCPSGWRQSGNYCVEMKR